MTAGWATDTPGRGGRNPGLCSQEVRLACAHRYGCITEADYRRSLDVARRRHRELLETTEPRRHRELLETTEPRRHLLETTEPRRKLRRLEFADAHKLGLRRAAEKTDEEVRAELGGHPHIGAEGDFWGTGSAADAKVSDEAADPAAGPLCVEHLEADFWDRPSLRTVYDGALALMASPWATLAYCVARALAQVRPGVKLPPLIGGPGSLNWFGAIAAISGGGKGAAHSVAKQLVPGDVTIRNPGSGEGTVQAYVIRGPKGVVDGYRESIMFDAAEVDALASLGARTASTLMPILRQGFSGETLGFAYSDSKKANHIDAHTYRMTLVLAVQPARAGAIFDDAAGGTPQRFMWFPAKDRRATVKTATGYVGSLALPDLGPRADWQKYGRELIVPGGAKELILSEREKSMRDEQDALDEHALFCREKFAFGLAIFDARTEMTSEDWRLSGIAAEVSTYVRCWVAGKLDEARRGEAAQLGELRGITNQVADDVRAFQASQQANRIAAWILRKLAEVGTEGLTEGRLRDLAANRDRHRIAAILGALAGKNLVKYDADTKKWVVA